MTTEAKKEHASIAAALAAAQMAMGPALKTANNPHFKTKYADLSAVVEACLEALNQNGIAVIQPTGEDELGRFVETRLIHTSGESLTCRVPLIVQKNDMQGYGSAVTYARRYGLMCMTGIAPEDDDGNAAAASAPKREERPAQRQERKPEAKVERDPSKIRESLITAIEKAADLEALAALNAEGSRFAAALAWLEAEYAGHADIVKTAYGTREVTLSNADLGGDDIPY